LNTHYVLKGHHIPPLHIQFDEGQRAFRRGLLECPYPENTMKAREWQRGSNLAYSEAKELLYG
jgi:hypothetical protein